jgi:hypothetical protein
MGGGGNEGSMAGAMALVAKGAACSLLGAGAARLSWLLPGPPKARTEGVPSLNTEYGLLVLQACRATHYVTATSILNEARNTREH